MLTLCFKVLQPNRKLPFTFHVTQAGAIDAPTEMAYDKLTSLTKELFRLQIALISMGFFMKSILVASFFFMSLFSLASAYAQLPSADIKPITPDTLKLAPVATSDFYNATSQNLVWSDQNKYAALLNALEGLSDHGLNPDDYHYNELIAIKGDKIARDRLATDAWFSAAANMLYGKVDPIKVEPDWTAAKRKLNLSASLELALKENAIDSSFEQFAPKQAGYIGLKAEYQRLKREAANPISTITAGAALKEGMTGPRVISLQARLSELDYLSQPHSVGVMDAPTVSAVKAFQIASDLDDDGTVGVGTLAALNRGPEAKLNQVLVNLERWRWLPDDLGQRHLRANIAGFNVTAWENNAPVRSYLTIVGKPYRKTPVFSDEIEYIVFNPWWEIPYSLATKDKLPIFRKDPSALQNLGIEVMDKSGEKVNSTTIDWNSISTSNFPYRLRQKPGEMNALGQVKIMFPNIHNVYLHDTPTRGLFSQRQRAFSSGCMRTQHPLELSAWLLETTPGWSMSKITSIVASGLETRANLAKKVPVHVLYFTAVYEGEFGIRYLDDIYERDLAVLNALRTKPSPK